MGAPPFQDVSSASSPPGSAWNCGQPGREVPEAAASMHPGPATPLSNLFCRAPGLGRDHRPSLTVETTAQRADHWSQPRTAPPLRLRHVNGYAVVQPSAQPEVVPKAKSLGRMRPGALAHGRTDRSREEADTRPLNRRTFSRSAAKHRRAISVNASMLKRDAPGNMAPAGTNDQRTSRGGSCLLRIRHGAVVRRGGSTAKVNVSDTRGWIAHPNYGPPCRRHI